MVFGIGKSVSVTPPSIGVRGLREAKSETPLKSQTLGFRYSLKAVLWVAGPKVASGALQLLFNWLLVRHLGPAHSGVLFACITAILLGDAVLGSAVDMSVIKLATGRDDACRSSSVQKTALYAKCAGCVVIGLPVLLWARPLSALLFHDD